jgi:hypothetical protein
VLGLLAVAICRAILSDGELNELASVPADRREGGAMAEHSARRRDDDVAAPLQSRRRCFHDDVLTGRDRAALVGVDAASRARTVMAEHAKGRRLANLEW